MYAKIKIGEVRFMLISEQRLNELISNAEERVIAQTRAELDLRLGFQHDRLNQLEQGQSLKPTMNLISTHAEKIYGIEQSMNASDKKRMAFESELLNSQLLLAQEIQKMRENFEIVPERLAENLGEITVKKGNVDEFDSLIDQVNKFTSSGRRVTISAIVQPESAKLEPKKKGGK